VPQGISMLRNMGLELEKGKVTNTALLWMCELVTVFIIYNGSSPESGSNKLVHRVQIQMSRCHHATI
jgi:hypothetical protein